MRSQQPVSSRLLRTTTLAAGICVIAMIWLLCWHQLVTVRESILQAKAIEHRNLVMIITENLRQVTDRARALGAVAVGADNVAVAHQAVLAGLLATDPVFNRLGLYSTDGQRHFATTAELPDQLPERWLSQLQSHADAFGAVPLLPTRSEQYLADLASGWRLPFLLPLRLNSQSLPGCIMLVELDLGYLVSLYQDLDLGRTGLIQLLDTDGVERLRADSAGLIVGGSSFMEHGDWASSPTDGYGLAVMEGRPERYLSVLETRSELGFSVAIRQQRLEVLQHYLPFRDRYITILLLTTLTILASVIWQYRRLSGHDQAMRALQSAEQRNRQLIERLEGEYARTHHAATTDHLTGLFNRRHFMAEAERRLSEPRARRQLHAVLFIDMDRFKTINDTLGHRIGDLLLQAVAGRIRQSLDSGDIAARFGGDEFVVLLGGNRTEPQIDDWAARLTAHLSENYHLDQTDLNTSPSIGIAISPRDAQNMESLVLCADAAMYSAKRAGRGQYQFYDASLNISKVEEFRLEQAFRDALQNREFVLHYQPKIALEGLRLVGYEALVRWQHPEYGLLYPDTFIGVAERSGFIVPLGLEVLRLACEQMAEWRSAGHLIGSVAVNVSPLQLGQPHFCDQVLDLLETHHLRPDQLELEITETTIVEQHQQAIQQLERLKRVGVGISLDDFGRGYAGFAHLKTLPIDTLKIDRGLIADIQNRHDDSLIVSSTIALARRLSLQVVAEGVETREQLVYLKLAGCDLAQGYHFSRPLPATEVRPFVEEFNQTRMTA